VGDDEDVFWEIDLAAYNDGVAYRYRVPKQDDVDEVTVLEERGDVRYHGVPTVHYTAFPDFNSDHEAEFHRDPLTGVMGPLVDLPLLASWPEGPAVGMTEARVRDYPSLYLVRDGNADSELFHTRLSPRQDRPEVSAVGSVPMMSPWRVFLLGDRAGDLLESNLLVCLNDPPRGDFSWAKPGKTTWHWWNGTFDRGPEHVPGMNLETHKRYIDFCAENGIAYHAVVADRRPWHVQSHPTFSPQPDTDILTPRADLPLDEILAYAKERGVGIRLWVHCKALDGHIEQAFQRYEEWGVAGLMVDFLNSDDQKVVQFCDRVLESAARHHLHIQFHGSYKPSGEQRTYPNLFNREAVLNLEYLKWSKRCTPPHNVEAAYVRQLAGPLDYHTGGFDARPSMDFVARNENPFVLGTRCHHLAMYVVYENPMPMVCDTPERYEGQTGFDFIVKVPTTWDETRFVEGEAGEYIVMARRSGSTWYLGGMNDWTPRALEMPLTFLSDATYAARVYVDGATDGDEPNSLAVRTEEVDSGSNLYLRMASGGGFAAILTPVDGDGD
jgi:alpha-glucosidase